jgi:hypothetical protein
MAPLQGVIFTGLVLLFLFLRPQGLAGRQTGTVGIRRNRQNRKPDASPQPAGQSR